MDAWQTLTFLPYMFSIINGLNDSKAVPVHGLFRILTLVTNQPDLTSDSSVGLRVRKTVKSLGKSLPKACLKGRRK